MENINALLQEKEQLKQEQQQILKAKFLNVEKLNKVNKRLYEIRQILHKHKIRENQQEEYYIS